MTTTLTRHDYFRPEYAVVQEVPLCEYHLTDCEWEDDRNYWFCPMCDCEGRQEDYMEDTP
jgi:hypothetical protein